MNTLARPLGAILRDKMRDAISITRDYISTGRDDKMEIAETHVTIDLPPSVLVRLPEWHLIWDVSESPQTVESVTVDRHDVQVRWTVESIHRVGDGAGLFFMGGNAVTSVYTEWQPLDTAPAGMTVFVAAWNDEDEYWSVHAAYRIGTRWCVETPDGRARNELFGVRYWMLPHEPPLPMDQWRK